MCLVHVYMCVSQFHRLANLFLALPMPVMFTSIKFDICNLDNFMLLLF